jgi:signal transduction histidine kinase
VLVVLLDLLIGGLIWLVAALAERPFPRWLRVRTLRWTRTYRGRLTLALFAFFVVPAVAFAVWSYQQIRADDRRTRELLVNETLSTIASDEAKSDLSEAEQRFDTPLFSYQSGILVDASDSLFGSLPPGGLTLPAAVQIQIAKRGELTAAWQQSLAGMPALFGYRAVRGPNEVPYVLSAPARSDELVLDRRRRDLGILVLFLAALGGVAALLLSGAAAKRLARDLELSRIEVARAERVIAWGEMARQIAHEIKNPLTPIRLGVQHLLRARRDDRGDFDKVLDENVGRILAEIDRLDEIARSFSRYGSAPADLPPAERVDAAAVLRDVVSLEQMGQGDVKWKLRGTEQARVVMARADELREVFLNVLENARLAGARRIEVRVAEEERRVTIEVLDDGSGIPQEVLPRLFEPHFSTRTTGSGLGLAASRRIIEYWGGEIAIGNREDRGARVLIALVRAA